MPSAKFSVVPKTTTGARLLVAIEHALRRGRPAGAELDVDELNRRGLLLDRPRVRDVQVGTLEQLAELGAAREAVMPKRWTKIVLGPIARIESRSDWSNPRMSAVMPTIDVMPMTTPSTVSAERILLVRTVSIAITTTSARRLARNSHQVVTPSSLFPQGLDRIEAGRAHGRVDAEEQSDQRGDPDAERDGPGLIDAGIGVNRAIAAAMPEPNAVPTTPPNIESTTDSVSICAMMSDRRAPSALRRPISRVRSVTTISMMFMMTMPPTTSDRPTTPRSTAKMPLVAGVVDVEDRVGREHAEVVRLLRLQAARAPQRQRRFVHRL